MFDILGYDFMVNALIASLLASVACGIIGTYIVTNRIVFVAGGISHASFGGIGMAFYLGIEPLIGALVFALGAAIAIGLVVKKSEQRPDTAIGMIWAVGMAVGVIFKRLTPGYTPDLASFLMGNILIVPTSELIIMVIINVIILITVFLLYKEFMAVSFDEEFASISGLPSFIIYLVMMCLIALTVVALIKMLGVILVIAMLSIPAAIAGNYTHSLKRMMGYSVIITSVCMLLGLGLAVELNQESGAMIVLVAAIIFIISTVSRKLTNYSKSKGVNPS